MFGYKVEKFGECGAENNKDRLRWLKCAHKQNDGELFSPENNAKFLVLGSFRVIIKKREEATRENSSCDMSVVLELEFL